MIGRRRYEKSQKESEESFGKTDRQGAFGRLEKISCGKPVPDPYHRICVRYVCGKLLSVIEMGEMADIRQYYLDNAKEELEEKFDEEFTGQFTEKFDTEFEAEFEAAFQARLKASLLAQGMDEAAAQAWKSIMSGYSGWLTFVIRPAGYPRGRRRHRLQCGFPLRGRAQRLRADLPGRLHHPELG